VDRTVRHNVLALGLDYSCYVIALSFASPVTILPAFATHLGASSVAIGAISAVFTLGWFLPSLFTAHHVERLEWKLPFVLRYTLFERLPLPLLAGVAFLVAGPAPGVALAVLFALLLMMSGTSGALMPAWMDVIARAIPTTLRGRFFGGANLVASAGGLVGSAGVAWVLARVAPPSSYGLCFLAGTVFLAVSYVALASTREPPGSAVTSSAGLGAYLRRMPVLLRRDRDLSWFLVARALGMLGGMANGFYTVYALRAWQAEDWRVGVFSALYLAGQMAGNVGFGWLADQAGHRLVIVLGVAALGAGNVVAFGAWSVETLGLVFVLSGIHQAAINISGRTILLELAPEGERPTYIGLSNTVLAPVPFLAPLAAGLLVDAVGFRAVFATAFVFGAAGLAVFLTRVREPRHQERAM